MISQYITLDFTARYLAPIYLNQYEVDSRDFIITCQSALSVPINLTGATVVFYAKKPDNNILFNSCTIIDAAAGKIQYTPTSQTCAAAGALTCQIVIVASDSSVLRSMEFTVTVNAGDDYSTAVESTSEFTALEEALASISEVGDMLKSQYATASETKVDTALNAEKLNGFSQDDTKTGADATTNNGIWTAYKILQVLAAVADGGSGADNIGCTPVGDGTAETVQGALEEINDAKIEISAIVNDLTTGGATVPLSAEQGKNLKDYADTGWIPLPTLTYVSATQATLVGDYTSVLRKSDKIRYKQGGAYKYNYIIADPSYSAGTGLTTITTTVGYITTEGDCSFANAAITDAYFSNIECPIGFPETHRHAPTYGGFSTSPSGILSRFSIKNSILTYFERESTNGTSNGSTFTISLPVVAKTITGMEWYGVCTIMDNSAWQTSPGMIMIASAGSVINVYKNCTYATFTTSGTKGTVGFQISYSI